MNTQNTQPAWFTPEPEHTHHPSGAPTYTRADLTAANQARTQANQTRGHYLHQLTHHTITIWQLIAAATHTRPLQAISLRTLLLASGKNNVKTYEALKKIRHYTPSTQRPTIRWLNDTKTWPRRILALTATTTPKHNLPWDGYPYSPPPPTLNLDHKAHLYTSTNNTPQS